MKPRVYISGPMRGLPDFNFPAFDRARDAFAARGWLVVSPADMDRADPHPPQPEEAVDRYVDRDLAAVRSLRRGTDDGLVLLDGWHRSIGAKAEVAVALWRGLKFYNEEGVPIYPVLSGGSY